MLAGFPTNTFLTVIESALVTAMSTNGKAGLFTNNPVLGPGTALTDLTEPTFTGYSRVALTPGTLRVTATGDLIVPLGTATFQPSGTTGLPETANGVFLAVGTTPALWIAELLDDPYTFATTGNAIDIVLELYIRAAQLYGMVCTTCDS